MSHITSEECDALQVSGLDKATPFIISCVTDSQWDVARSFGGCKIRGRRYLYLPETDELVRDDVIEWLASYRKM